MLPWERACGITQGPPVCGRVHVCAAEPAAVLRQPASSRPCPILLCVLSHGLFPALPHPALSPQPWALPLPSLQLPSCASASLFQHPLSLLSSLPVQTLFTLLCVCAHTLIWLLPMSLFATLSAINIMPIVLRGAPHCCGTTTHTLDPCLKACSIEQQVQEMILKKEKRAYSQVNLGDAAYCSHLLGDCPFKAREHFPKYK